MPRLPPAWPKHAPHAFHVLAKPTGAVCNLDCSYCFYLSKQDLYPGSRFRLRDDILDAYVRQLLESQRAEHVAVSWQGGEPTLMGLNFFRRVVELVERHRRPGQTVEHTLQTNGTRLDATWCAFLAENQFLVGLSIDGPRELHDTYRVDKHGRGTFDRVRNAADLLGEHGVAFNALTAVHAANGDHPLEVYGFVRDELATDFVQLIPIVEPMDGGPVVTERSVVPGQWGAFLAAIFEEWVRHDVGRVFVQMFDTALASWLGVPPSLCIFAETCGDGLAFEHNGDVYACDHFVDVDHLLGNIMETHLVELVASPRQRAFGAAKRDTLPGVCRECEVLFACRGECPKNRFVTSPDGEPGLNYLCAGYGAFFRQIDDRMRSMADLVRRGEPAAGIMETPAGQQRRRQFVEKREHPHEGRHPKG